MKQKFNYVFKNNGANKEFFNALTTVKYHISSQRLMTPLHLRERWFDNNRLFPDLIAFYYETIW